jgi:hypothetical protein
MPEGSRPPTSLTDSVSRGLPRRVSSIWIHTLTFRRLKWVCRDQTMVKRGFRPMRRAHEHYRACGRGQSACDYCLCLMMPCASEEAWSDSGDHSARTDRSPASVAAAFYRRGKMVGREGSRQGAGIGAAGAGTPRADRSLDHRRYELSVGVSSQIATQSRHRNFETKQD